MLSNKKHSTYYNQQIIHSTLIPLIGHKPNIYIIFLTLKLYEFLIKFELHYFILRW
jgi:hypothetical protein